MIRAAGERGHVPEVREIPADASCRSPRNGAHMSMSTRSAILPGAGSPVGDHGGRAGRTEGQRGAGAVPRRGVVPLRRPHPEGRCGDAFPVVGGHEGAGVVDAVGAGVTRVSPRRSRGLLVHPGLRIVPLLLDRAAEPPRRGQERRDRRVPGRDVPVPPRGRGPRRTVRAGHLFRVRGALRALLHQDRRGDPVRGGRAGHCGVPTGWGSAVHAAGVRGGSGGVQAGHGPGVRGRARVRGRA